MKPESLVSEGHQCCKLQMTIWLWRKREIVRNRLDSDSVAFDGATGNDYENGRITILILNEQHHDDLAAVESFAEYVPAPCTHRPSSHLSGVLVRPVMNSSNQGSAKRAKS